MNNGDLQQIRNWIKEIDTKLDNHLHRVSADIAEIKTDMSWVKRFFWLIITISMGAILTAFYSLILR